MGASSECRSPENLNVVQIPRWQRWQIWQRLQELSIPAWCPEDGQLHVEIENGLAATQLWSVVHQFRSPRVELVAWLEQCWGLPDVSE